MYTPEYRMRRLRANANIRALVRETHLSADDFILPYFVVPGKGKRHPIKSMPGHFQLSIDELIADARQAMELGIRAVILFGIPEHKDPLGSDATSDEGIISRALRALKEALPELYVITDVCFCEYTDHGHCGLLHGNDVENDGTLAMLQDQVRVHARNGADMVAPSGMMDGMVGAIREALDDEGYANLPIMSYAVKYASGFYGPFRDAAESAPQFGDRSSYQMDPANGNEAMREAAIDIEEGADIIMVKPAMPYLDILHRVREEFGMPTAAYQVSGEFAMIKAAAANGWLDHDRVMLESLISIKRAGADLILTYFAREAAEKLRTAQ
ncbi:MAG TPA: porphobilinogen synthase [Caldithrix abyssi]|uniref:Delta-aminolevulinic acid dehydratase n=1 Tax=Caldithrix abyssi TaxID=187145 RepID=A0A7V5VEJ7_CALAY|nr:porphobilinogen synthase [Caldithrix abyssi]